MNPYRYFLNQLPAVPQGDYAWYAALLTLLGDAYSSGFSGNTAEGAARYVIDAVTTKFGATHQVSIFVARELNTVAHR